MPLDYLHESSHSYRRDFVISTSHDLYTPWDDLFNGHDNDKHLRKRSKYKLLSSDIIRH